MKCVLATFFTILGFSLSWPYSSFADTLTLGDHVISTDTTWSGQVVIKGVVVVGRKATLKIAPGTKILFKKIDRNKDHIGDSEIRVLGRLLAEGTKGAPILFQSAESAPAPSDWSYLLIFASSAVNSIQYCQFKHGFTGLQIHFSTAHVRDCLFEENNEGIRFGRTKLTLEHNTFRENRIGVRFTRMEGPVVMRRNKIIENRIGVFLAPSGQNIVDFFEPSSLGGKAWNEGHLEITSNAIHDNREYNLVLGAKQKWDLKITDNWWNITDAEAIRATIFDRSRDNELGAALFEPFANKADNNVGVRDEGTAPSSPEISDGVKF